MMTDNYYCKWDLYMAEDNIKKVLKIIPKNYNANILLVNIEMANKKNDLTKAIFDDMIKLEPENPSACFRLGISTAWKRTQPKPSRISAAPWK